jgi:hypothetical protein
MDSTKTLNFVYPHTYSCTFIYFMLVLASVLTFHNNANIFSNISRSLEASFITCSHYYLTLSTHACTNVFPSTPRPLYTITVPCLRTGATFPLTCYVSVIKSEGEHIKTHCNLHKTPRQMTKKQQFI